VVVRSRSNRMIDLTPHGQPSRPRSRHDGGRLATDSSARIRSLRAAVGRPGRPDRRYRLICQ
jgi:hypothetical protein